MFRFFKKLTRQRVTYPKAPEGLVVYAIGDIHGRSDCLRTLHSIIDEDTAKHFDENSVVEVYLGDYVDRGPDSRGVIDLLTARSRIKNLKFVEGNHEILLKRFLNGKVPLEEWRAFGGLETALSYGVDVRSLMKAGGVGPQALGERMPDSHTKFLESLRCAYRMGDYIFVHAGVRPGVALQEQSIDDMAWIRDEFTSYEGTFGAVVVHGHTPTREVEFLPNRINIDTGAYVSNRLSAIRIDANGVTLLTGAEA